MYRLACEDVPADYKSPFGRKSITLKNGFEVAIGDIKTLYEDGDARRAIDFYYRFRRYGLPYRDWADCPNILVEVVDLLEPLDGFYHPKMI